MSDGLDDKIWRRTVKVIEAAHRGDVKAHTDEWRSWDQELSIQERRRMEWYIRYLLGLWLHRYLRADYDAAKLRAIADTAFPRTVLIVKVDVDRLCEVFRDALNISEPEDTMRGVAVDMIASAALGALLQDPAQELEQMRAPLAAYRAKYADELRELEEQG